MVDHGKFKETRLLCRAFSMITTSGRQIIFRFYVDCFL